MVFTQLLILKIFTASLFLLILFSMFHVFPRIWGAPYQPTNNKKLKIILELSKFKKGERMIDLGSGNGKIVIAFAKEGVESYGVEINPILVWWSRKRIKKLNLPNAHIIKGNFFDIDFSKFDIVVMFQMHNVMGRLEEKLKREISKNTRVISHYWKMPSWKIKEKISNVYRYALD